MNTFSVENIPFNGRCLCGNVQFAGVGIRDFAMCHCRQCQRGHGVPACYSATAANTLTVDHRQSLVWYASSNHARRGFCGNCGTSLFWQGPDRSTIAVAAGAIDSSHRRRLKRHIFVEGKPELDAITDDLPQYAGTMNERRVDS